MGYRDILCITFDRLALAAGSAEEVGIRQISDSADVFVTPAGQVHQNRLVCSHGFGQLHGVSHGVAGFQRRDDAFRAAQVVKRFQRLFVGDADVLGAANVVEEGVLRAVACTTFSRIGK